MSPGRRAFYLASFRRSELCQLEKTEIHQSGNLIFNAEPQVNIKIMKG